MITALCRASNRKFGVVDNSDAEIVREKPESIDAVILELVQRNNGLTSEELGNLSIFRRPHAEDGLTRADRIIEADVSIVSLGVAGRDLTMLVLVSLKCEREDIVERV